MDVIHRRLATRIKAAAKQRRIVLSHVPDRAGVTRSHFWRVLDGTASPTLAWVVKVAGALELDPGALVCPHRLERRQRGRREDGGVSGVERSAQS